MPCPLCNEGWPVVNSNGKPWRSDVFQYRHHDVQPRLTFKGAPIFPDCQLNGVEVARIATGRPQASPRIEEPQNRPADSSDGKG